MSKENVEFKVVDATKSDVWCTWCRDHDTGYRPDQHAVTHNIVYGTGRAYPYIEFSRPFPGQKDGYVHIHDAILVTPAELTVKAAVKRTYRRVKNKVRSKILRLTTRIDW